MIMLFTGWNVALWRALMTPWLDWPPAPRRQSAEVIQISACRHG